MTHRGIAGLFERSWSGRPGAIPWTRLLLPLSLAYGVAAGRARASAARSRRRVSGLYVLALGNLTVGGAGKSSIARWLSGEIVGWGGSPGVLLRGHGARRRARGTYVLPDFEGYPIERSLDRAGDEAAAHRAALPGRAAVAVDRDRRRAAEVVRDGFGATVVILDDGWEQRHLSWDALWVALDPLHPAGNGALLPAGPLRRPESTLHEASVIAFVLEEEGEEVPRITLEWVAGRAPRALVLRFRRVLEGISRVGERRAGPEIPGPDPVALLSGIGAPERLTRFARGAGIQVVRHAAFPDHARWGRFQLRDALRAAAGAGARIALITEKDEPRWPEGLEEAIPVRVLRTRLLPLDPVDGAIAGLRRAVEGLRAGELPDAPRERVPA